MEPTDTQPGCVYWKDFWSESSTAVRSFFAIIVSTGVAML